MRKLIVSVSAAAMISISALTAVATGASASATMIPRPGGASSTPASSAPADPTVSFTTTMISYTPVNLRPGGLAAGDGYVLAGRVTRAGAPDGLSTAQCTYTDTAGPVLRICTVDYALDNGLIVTSGFINGPGKGAPVTLVVNGGTGAFAGARGYGTLQPTAAGSHVTVHLAG
jgi:hypothetical protein